MRAWLIDLYRSEDNIVLWCKTQNGNERLAYTYNPTLYCDATPEAARLLRKYQLPFLQMQKRTCSGKERDVFSFSPHAADFEQIIRKLEQDTRHRLALYNADITPELQFMYNHDVKPGTYVEFPAFTVLPQKDVPLSTRHVVVHTKSGMYNVNEPIAKIDFNDTCFTGGEEELLRAFAAAFQQQDPDVLIAPHAFSQVPYLAGRLAHHGIACQFHRWDNTPLVYRGGRSYFTYGLVRYQDYAIRLHGRLLIDTTTMLGSLCSVSALVELSQLSGERIQHLASRSAGAVFQMALMRALYRDGFLIPYKEKPLAPPLTMTELLKADRAGHTMDALIGFHKNVAEVDFFSMFPWLMYERNISAERFFSNEPPFEYAPGLSLRISVARKGYVPLAIKPFLERRRYYKEHPSPKNSSRAAGLKAVLVSSNGYLRFREFKLGMPITHMALCAYAREAFITAKLFAEEQGFDVVHGIVDALYLTRSSMTQHDVALFAKEAERLVGIPLYVEGLFKWIVFLPSVNDQYRPMPARYYGVFHDGSIKARGIEVRQRSSPLLVRQFQQACLERMSACADENEILTLVPSLGAFLRDVLRQEWTAQQLACRVCLGKEVYKHDVPQRRVLEKLRERGISVAPGKIVRFVHTTQGVALLDEYKSNPDVQHYRKLLVRSLFVLLQPFGIKQEQIMALAMGQTTLG